LKECVCELASYIERKVNKTITLQETRTRPNLLQQILADDFMRKRWKLKTEDELFRKYEGDVDVSYKELSQDYNYIYFCSKVYPTQRQLAKAKLESAEFIYPMWRDADPLDQEGNEIEPIEPTNDELWQRSDEKCTQTDIWAIEDDIETEAQPDSQQHPKLPFKPLPAFRDPKTV